MAQLKPISHMNIGFLFLTNDDIIHDETKKFVKHYSVYVNAKTPDKIKNNPGYTVSTHKTQWGEKSIVDATIKMLEVAHTKKHLWYVLLAYDSLPLTRPSTLEKFLRYQSKSLFNLIENAEKEWKASQWWILSHTDVEIILKYFTEYDNFVSKYPYSEISGAWDEMYFLSLLKYVNQSYKFMEYKTTFTKWLEKPIQRHPVTYGKLLESDIEECKHSFFIRKTTPSLCIKIHQPKKKLFIKIFGTKTKNFQIPDDADLIIISLVTNDNIPENILNTAVRIYYSIYTFLGENILEVLYTLPCYLWKDIYIFHETTNLIKDISYSPQMGVHKTILNKIKSDMPNPPQFYNIYTGCYKYVPNKIAFLFLTIGDIHQPEIWTNYLKNKQHLSSVYINPKHPALIKTEWLENMVIPNHVENTKWGHITEAYHRLLDEAVKDQDNVKFVFISESCIPLKSFDSFYEKMMRDDLRTSYIKFMKPSAYDTLSRIKTQPGYKEHEPFVKHFARMCLSRYHAEKLLEQDFTFFNNMHVGDEFFLTLIHPEKGKDFIEDFEITYDNWEGTKKKTGQLSDDIKTLKSKHPNEFNENTIRRKKIMKDDIGGNPITYSSITTDEIQKATKKESFFWRKFLPGPLPWTNELLSILPTETNTVASSPNKPSTFIKIKPSIKPQLNTNKNRVRFNKTNKKKTKKGTQKGTPF